VTQRCFLAAVAIWHTHTKLWTLSADVRLLPTPVSSQAGLAEVDPPRLLLSRYSHLITELPPNPVRYL
jgi:hypothetical protein